MATPIHELTWDGSCNPPVVVVGVAVAVAVASVSCALFFILLLPEPTDVLMICLKSKPSKWKLMRYVDVK